MSDNLTDWLRSANPDSECNDIRCEEAADEIDRLRAENARLRDALGSFAAALAIAEGELPKVSTACNFDALAKVHIGLVDFRRARDALKGGDHE